MTREEILARVGPELHGLLNEALDGIWKINPDIQVVDCKIVNGRVRLFLGFMSIKDFDIVYDIVRDAEDKSVKLIEVRSDI